MRIWLSLLLLLLAFGGARMLLDRQVTPLLLEVVTEPDGEVVHRMPTAAGAQFQLRFTHSVEQSEVVEYFRVAADRTLLLEGTLYHAQGVGLPFDEAGAFAITPEGMRWQDLNRRLPEIRLRTLPLTQHVLLIEHQSIHLSDPRWAGKRLVIRVRTGRMNEKGD